MAKARKAAPQKKKEPETKRTRRLKIVYRNPVDLKPAEYNPRKVTSKDRQDILNSIEEYGVVLPLVVNKHPERNDVIIGGNQRWKVLQDLGYDEVPTVEENLNLEEEKKLNLRLNKNQGRFDDELLEKYFDYETLLEAGWSEKELKQQSSDYEARLNSITNEHAEMPIVPKFSEAYHSILIFVDNDLDYNWILNVLNLKSRKDYKNRRTGVSHVLTVQEFQKILEERI